MTERRSISQPFRPRARVLQLLGDELIGSARLAVFELVKNAYDADANEVVVRLDLTEAQEPTITVIDDGDGMTLDVLQSVWLVPGNDHRQKQRLSGRRTARHRRLPLGEKGLGRFAVHKLGNRIILVTRARDADECVVDIDWNELIAQPYLDEAPVTIQVRRPEVFSGEQKGTRIEVRHLRNDWPRGEVRRLHNQITSICSPFEEPGGFRATLNVPGREGWIHDLPHISQILDRAIWKFSFHLDNERFDWRYEFRQIPGFRLDGRLAEKSGDRLKLPRRSSDDLMVKKVVADASDFEGIGPITGEFYVYDRDREVRRRVPNIGLVETWLDETGGVRVYRDGIRVYNYGELGDDWLGLDLRRVNVPTRRISRNIILGAIHLSLKESSGLIEKTNREGFVDNESCRQLRRIVLGTLAALEEERQFDKERIRRLTATPDDPTVSRIEKPIQALRSELERQGLQKQFDSYLVRIENDYRNMQETLLSAGMSGLNLAVVFHEVERGVRGAAPSHLQRQGPGRRRPAGAGSHASSRRFRDTVETGQQTIPQRAKAGGGRSSIQHATLPTSSYSSRLPTAGRKQGRIPFPIRVRAGPGRTEQSPGQRPLLAPCKVARSDAGEFKARTKAVCGRFARLRGWSSRCRRRQRHRFSRG